MQNVSCWEVELLFQEGLVRLLFATETFSMGVNMPARAVVFTSLRKWDGEAHRPPSAAEYIQMSGRAGRRGLDTRGVVVQMIDDRTDTSKVREMLTGSADTLSSRFHLSYNMLLNCVRGAAPRRSMAEGPLTRERTPTNRSMSADKRAGV